MYGYRAGMGYHVAASIKALRRARLRPRRRFVSDEIELLSQLIRQGDYVVDAGAHVGAVTVPLARIVGAQGKVL